jgi:hypothetical protein
LPAYRKLATARQAAENTKAGEGDRFIAAAAEKFSSRYESLRNNAVLRAFSAEHPIGQAPFQFDL